MSSLTPRLALKRPDTTDGFVHQDFVDNYNKIDGAPGRYICTSTSRPTWGTAQAGMQIKEVDTKRTLEWTGTSWAEPLVSVGEWGLWTHPSQYVNANTTVTYTLGTVTVSRPLLLCGIVTFRVAARMSTAQTVRPTVIVDGTECTFNGDDGGVLCWNPGGTADLDHRVSTVLFQKSVAVGTHTIQGRINVGNNSTSNIYVGNIQALVFTGVGTGGSSVNL